MGLTITKIAKELNISPSTVSKALNNREGIGNLLRLKIQKYAEERGYRPYIVARETGMYDRKINIISVFYSPFMDPNVIKNIQEGIESVFYSQKYYSNHFIVNLYYNLNTDVKKELILRETIKKSNLTGIIFSFMDVSEQILNFLHKNNVTSILLNHYTETGKCVYINETETMYNTIKSLISLGRKNIGIIVPDETVSYIWDNRIKGYIKALQENGIKYDPDLITFVSSPAFEDLRIVINRVIENNSELDAVVFSNNIQSVNGIKILKDLNIKIPEDIAVINFGNINYNLMVDPMLSSVEMPLFEMGKRSAQLLINSIINNNFSSESVKLDAKIVLRESCIKYPDNEIRNEKKISFHEKKIVDF